VSFHPDFLRKVTHGVGGVTLPNGKKGSALRGTSIQRRLQRSNGGVRGSAMNAGQPVVNNREGEEKKYMGGKKEKKIQTTNLSTRARTTQQKKGRTCLGKGTLRTLKELAQWTPRYLGGGKKNQ